MNSECCCQLIFRASVNSYVQGGRYVESKELNLLKRKSCKCGCCDWLLEALNEQMGSSDYPTQIEDEFVDRALYELKVTNHGPEDFEVGFVRVEE